MKRRFGLVGCAFLALAGLACSSPSAPRPAATAAFTSPTPYPTATPSAPWLASPDLIAFEDRARETAAAQPSFGGAWAIHHAFGMYVATTDVAAMSRVLDEFRRQGLVFYLVEVRHTYLELAALADRIGIDREAGLFDGVALSGWGVNELCNCVNIEVTNLTYEQRVSILSRYGPRVTVEEGGPWQLDMAD